MGARGEQTIVTRDGEVRLLYTNRALAEGEQATGKSVIAVCQGFLDGESGVTEMAHLLKAGMEAARRDARTGGRPVQMGDAYDVLDQAGFQAVSAAVMGGIAEVLAYDPEEEGEDDPNP